MEFTRNIAAGFLGAAALVLIACNSDNTSTSPDQAPSALSAPGINGSAPVEVKCERRSNRSKISVDGNNLARGRYTARVTSGGNSRTSPARQSVGDEVEFDFDSNRNDIAAGATAIPANFIVINPNGPDVTGRIINASGVVVRTQSVNCQVR
jgi:hypothetical protein